MLNVEWSFEIIERKNYENSIYSERISHRSWQS